MTHHLKVMALASVAMMALTVSLNAQTLTVTNDLRLWLDAGAATTTNATGGVTNWVDQSTNVNNATAADAAAPLFVDSAINGKPALRFFGTNQMSVLSNASIAITGDMALFAVVNFDPPGGRRSIWGFPLAVNDFGLESNNKPRLRRPSVKDCQVVFQTGQYLLIGFQQAGSDVSFYRSDQTIFTQVNDDVVSASGVSLRIGNGAGFMRGYIAELLIYGAALSEADRLSVASYLETKYGITNLPPTVSLASSPADGSTVGAPTSVTLTATAADPDGTIKDVGFYANGQLLGSATIAPYQLTVSVQTPGTATFTAVASDNRDKTTVSAPVSLTVTGAIPSLTVTNGLQLWLDAGVGVVTNASGAVTNWADQSGNGNNAEQTNDPQAPLYVAGALNGLPTVRFDGAVLNSDADFMSVAHNPDILGTNNNNVSSFFVIKFDDFGMTASGPRTVWAKDEATGLSRPMAYYITGFGSGIFRASRNAPAPATDTVTSAVNPVPRQKYMVAGFSMDTNSLVGQTGANILTHYWNGLANSGKGTFGTLVAVDEGTPLRIGATSNFGGKMRGEIAELLIYNPGLSGADAFAVQRYLAAKYNIPMVAPVPTVSLSLATNGTDVVLSWPGLNIPAGLTLRSATNLTTPTWISDTNKLTAVGLNYQVTNSAGLDQQYYRLQAP